ncbi:MobP3 family relaxase, partial [Dysosmobacter sp.]|uniref:MobP3 family relaxase n=1 Tax=Dysosmobacter sp. TaxID=2591382 RepID=UPI003AEF597F
MARIVLISPYLKGGQNAAKLAQRTRYVATRPGVELLADERSTLPATKKQQDFITRLLKSFPSCWELIEYEEYLDHPTQGNASAFIQQVRENYMEALDQKENFIDYISQRPGVQKDGEHGLWDAHGKVQNLARAVREVAEHTGNVWTPVVALRREDAERLGYDSAESWRALVNASVCDIAAAYKIQPDNLRWYAAFHQKPNQVHIHMVIFSADPKEGYLTKEGIRQVKSVFARRIYHADRMHIYQQKDIARQELQTRTRKAMVECIAQLEHGSVDNPRLEQLTEELAERLLAVKGRKVYGYLPPRVKAIVDAIVEEIAKD